MSMVFNEANFDAEVLKSQQPVLVDFWAAWCLPCKMLGPTIDSLEAELKGAAKIGKLNVDENKDLSSKYGIMSIPTVFIFKNGEVVEQLVGVQPKATYIDALKKHL